MSSCTATEHGLLPYEVMVSNKNGASQGLGNPSSAITGTGVSLDQLGAWIQLASTSKTSYHLIFAMNLTDTPLSLKSPC